MSALTRSPKPAPPMAQVLRHRDFRLLWLGQATSLLGDQFAFIAMPWLVLRLTGDPLALGLVLALAAIPRAGLMLIGGAVVDRYSPRAIMLASDLLRMVLVTWLAILVFTGTVQVWMVYAFSLAFGLISGFFQPASTAIVPGLVPPAELQAGNAVFMGTGQLAGLAGPALAGGVIGWLAHTGAGDVPGLTGIGLALGIDAVTFIASVATLWAMHGGRAAGAPAAEGLLKAIGAGLRYAWSQPLVRMLFLVTGLANLLLLGPLLVGIPVLADTRLAEGAVAFGLIMSAWAGGNLLGAVLAGSRPDLVAGRLRPFVAVLLTAFGLGLTALGWIRATALAGGVLLLLGVGNGAFAITVVTLIQRGTPKAMLGRLMSLLLFASIGLLPLSEAMSGAVSRWSVTGLFMASGAAMVLLAGWTVRQPSFELVEAGGVEV